MYNIQCQLLFSFAEFSDYNVKLPHTVPISEEFGVNKIIQIDGIFPEEATRDFPVLSFIAKDETEVLNIVINPEKQLVLITSPTLRVIRVLVAKRYSDGT